MPSRVSNLKSVLTCPECGVAKEELIPDDACLFFYVCSACDVVLRPRDGDCCVFCSYGSRPCPSSEPDFGLKSAQLAASANELHRWVITYLRGPGNNSAFADGLERRIRHWRGPELIPLGQLERTCGPEPHMPFREPLESWRIRIARITSDFAGLDALPPVIAQYQSGRLLVNDGNHRLAAFEALGLASCWVIVWYADEGELEHHERLGFQF